MKLLRWLFAGEPPEGAEEAESEGAGGEVKGGEVEDRFTSASVDEHPFNGKNRLLFYSRFLNFVALDNRGILICLFSIQWLSTSLYPILWVKSKPLSIRSPKKASDIF